MFNKINFASEKRGEKSKTKSKEFKASLIVVKNLREYKGFYVHHLQKFSENLPVGFEEAVREVR